MAGGIVYHWRHGWIPDERYARANASEELRAWLDNHGSFTTLADYRASILGGHRAKGRQSWY